MKVQEQSATYLAQTISGGWCEKRLRNLLTKLVDGSHNPPPKQDSGLPMLSARNIENNNIVFDEYRLISESSFKTEHARTRITAGDVLLTIVGTIGRAAVVPEAVAPFALQRSVAVLTPGPELLPKFLVYQLQSPVIQCYFEANARGTAQKGVYLKTLGQTPIQVAPLDQQKHIVAEIEKQFSRLDEAVANLKRVKANLKRYKAAVLKAAVEGKLTEAWRKQNLPSPAGGRGAGGEGYEPASELLQRILAERRAKWEQAELTKMQAKSKIPKDDAWKKKYPEPAAPDTTDLPELPEGWVWAKTDQLFWFVTSGSRGWAEYYSDEGAQFLRIGNLDHNSISIDFSDLQRVSPPKGAEGTRTRVEPGDILVSITADVGMIAIAPRFIEESYINQHISLARPVVSLNGDFLAWFLCSKNGQDQFKELQRGATKAGLGLDDIRGVNVPLPPLDEQSAIVAELDRYLTLADEAEAQVNVNHHRADRLRQAILSKAFPSSAIAS